MKENGLEFIVAVVTEPFPFSVIVTDVAFPPKVLLFTVKGLTPQALPVRLPSVNEGPLTHPHDTVNALPVVIQPPEFLTVIECEPLLTSVKVLEDWNTPLSSLYSRPKLMGLVTVTSADPKPKAQFILCSGMAGAPGALLMVASLEVPEVQPC